MNALAVCYEYGEGVTLDLSKALEIYLQACELDYVNSLFNAAHSFYTGTGTPVNYERAMELFKRAAKKGHAKSMFFIGNMYKEGQGTINKCVNLPMAAEYMLHSAMLEFDRAIPIIAEMYKNGQGVEMDYMKAAHWYEEMGDEDEAEKLRVMWFGAKLWKLHSSGKCNHGLVTIVCDK